MTEIHAVMIEGPFEEAEWAAVMTAIRVIERRHPERKFIMVAITPGSSMAEAQAMLSRTYPRVDGKEPEIVALPTAPIDRLVARAERFIDEVHQDLDSVQSLDGELVFRLGHLCGQLSKLVDDVRSYTDG